MNAERLQIALRVLHDICRHSHPQESDLAALARMAETEEERLMMPDDLACAVIGRERRRLRPKLLAPRY